MPSARQASRIVEPAGTVTAIPSIVSSIEARSGSGGGVGGTLQRSGGVRRMSVSGCAPGGSPRWGVSRCGAGSRSRDSPSWLIAAFSQRHELRLPDGALDRAAGRLAEAADRRVAHRLADVAQERQLVVVRAV